MRAGFNPIAHVVVSHKALIESAVVAYLKETNQYHIVDTVYKKAIDQREKVDAEILNLIEPVMNGEQMESFYVIAHVKK